MADRLLLVVGFGVMGITLAFVAYQTVLLGRMVEHVATLIVRTH
jgi:hypothetical protein